jgi:signal transduction histidine kinase
MARGPEIDQDLAGWLRHALWLYLKIAGIWTPLLCAAFVVTFSSLSSFLTRWLVAVTIGLVTASICYWAVHLVEILELWILRMLDRPIPRHGHLWSFLLAIIFMPFALHLGFQTAQGLGPLVGYRFSAPDLSDYRVSIMFGVLVCALFFFLEVHRDARAAKREAELRLQQTENERLRAQIAALTSQINPHLLFNSLNTIASLIATKPAAAEEMTVQLSDLFRGILTASRRETHPLATELEICRTYLEIERTRFGERLRRSFEIEPDLDLQDCEVPVLIVQPLVENAVKYAVAPRSGGGEVAVRVGAAGDLVEIAVEDDGPGFGRSPARPGAGTGIASCRSRLELHFGERGQLELEEREGGGTRARITFPRGGGRRQSGDAVQESREGARGDPSPGG